MQVFSMKIVFFTNSQKFSPSKVSRYTICHFTEKTSDCMLQKNNIIAIADCCNEDNTDNTICMVNQAM